MDEQDVTKMVSFRLQVDKYAKLEEVRSIKGLRSVSDLFREAVEKLIQELTATKPTRDPLSFRIRELEKKLDSLALDVKKLKKVGSR